MGSVQHRRQLDAILSIDMTQYSWFMALDESSTHEIAKSSLQRFEKLLKKYGGQTAEMLSGGEEGSVYRITHTMLDGQSHAGDVVIGNAVTHLIGCVAVEHYHWNRMTGLHDHFFVHPRRGEDQSINPKLEQILDRRLFLPGLPVAGVEENSIAEFTGSRLDTGDNIAEKRVAKVGNHHPENSSSLLDQAPRHHIRPVVDLLDGAKHGFPAFRADALGAPGHHRDQRFRHAGNSRNIVNCWV